MESFFSIALPYIKTRLRSLRENLEISCLTRFQTFCEEWNYLNETKCHFLSKTSDVFPPYLGGPCGWQWRGLASWSSACSDANPWSSWAPGRCCELANILELLSGRTETVRLSSALMYFLMSFPHCVCCPTPNMAMRVELFPWNEKFLPFKKSSIIFHSTWVYPICKRWGD